MAARAEPEQTTPSPGDARPALLWLGAYAVFRFGVGVAQLPLATPGWVLLLANALVALGSIGLPIAGIAALSRLRAPAWRWLLLALVGVAVWLGLALLTPGRPSVLLALSATVQDLGKILGAAGLGLALANGIREPNILFPAAIFAAFADFVVVNFGTVKHALSNPKGQALVKAVSAQVPAVHPGLVPLTIGPADFLFLGLFLGCAARFRMGLVGTAWVLALVLALSLVLVPLIGPIPALAPMSLAFAATNWRHFRLSREELVGSIVVLIVAGALFLGYFLALGRR